MMAIAVQTIELLQRNRTLQMKLAQLKAEATTHARRCHQTRVSRYEAMHKTDPKLEPLSY